LFDERKLGKYTVPIVTCVTRGRAAPDMHSHNTPDIWEAGHGFTIVAVYAEAAIH
jgi:hypothetical protein